MQQPNWCKPLFQTIPAIVLPLLLVTACASRLPELPLDQELIVKKPQPKQAVKKTDPLPEATDQSVNQGVNALEIAVLHKAEYNPFERDNGKSFRAINTLESYRAELGRHSIETAKPVDFRSSQILASSVGVKPGGGYKVTVTQLDEYEDRIIATVVQTEPGANCVNTQERTHPFEFVLVPSLKPIEILEKKQALDC